MQTIFIDGIDATGKSSILKLAETDGIQTVAEFSSTSIGDIIRDVIVQKDFFCIGSGLCIAESLLLLSDHFAKLEQLVSRSGTTISERGLLSLLSFQSVRLRHSYGEETAARFEGICNSLLELPMFGKQQHIILTADQETVLKRKSARGDPIPSHRETQILMEIQRYMISKSDHWGAKIFDTTMYTPEMVYEKISKLDDSYT
jgi:thymidylate kinase